jgi:hypothetical protein
MVLAFSIDSASPGSALESGKMVEGSAGTLPPPVRLPQQSVWAYRGVGRGSRQAATHLRTAGVRYITPCASTKQSADWMTFGRLGRRSTA